MSITTSNRSRRWTEAEVTILRQEVAQQETKEKAFQIVAEKTDRSAMATGQKWHALTTTSGKAGKKNRENRSSETVQKPKAKLSTGFQLMQKVMGSEMSASSITITPTEMIIKF